MNQNEKQPSKIALSFFNWYCRPDYKEEIEGDLLERFDKYCKEHGYSKANRLFIWEVILLFRPAVSGDINQLTNLDMVIDKENKRLITIVVIASAILLIPLVAMNFTEEVKWSAFDFIIAGVLLIGTGLLLELILRKVKTKRSRVILGVVLILLLMLIWAELAVGIFGTPFAGS